jgi:hypothetical protein
MTSAEFNAAKNAIPAMSASEARAAFFLLLGGLGETVTHLADGGGMLLMDGVLSSKGIEALHDTIQRAVNYGKETSL